MPITASQDGLMLNTADLAHFPLGVVVFEAIFFSNAAACTEMPIFNNRKEIPLQRQRPLRGNGQAQHFKQ